MWRTVEQKALIFFEAGMRVALADMSMFHACVAITQEVALHCYASSPHPYLLYEKRDSQFYILELWSDSFLWIMSYNAYSKSAHNAQETNFLEMRFRKK